MQVLASLAPAGGTGNNRKIGPKNSVFSVFFFGIKQLNEPLNRKHRKVSFQNF